MFKLHSQLAADCAVVGRRNLALVLLHGDSRFPWCILVPQRKGIREIHQLDSQDRSLLMTESCELAEVMAELFGPDKMNVASLGNLVPQLHIHHVARYQNDEAWPGPIWGQGTAKPYDEVGLAQRLAVLRKAMERYSDWQNM